MSFVLTRTPYRVSFMGGGSDLPAYYEQDNPGMVIGATINKYMHISVNTKFDDRYRICYSKTEETASSRDIRHDLARECIARIGVPFPVEVHACGDVPAGTGLGSSSVFTVGLIHALRVWRNQYPVPPSSLAEYACAVEIDMLRKPIGKQDQYLSAYGGCNQLTFNRDGSVEDQAIGIRAFAHRSILLLRIGGQRSSDTILTQQARRLAYNSEYRAIVRTMVEMVVPFRDALGVADYQACGRMLDEAWELKKRLADGISSSAIDDAYIRALGAGAYGGKLCGAGGSGYLMLFVPSERTEEIIAATRLKALDYRFEDAGSQVVYHY